MSVCPNNLRVQSQAVISLEFTHARTRAHARARAPDFPGDESLAIPMSWRCDSVAPLGGRGKGGGSKMGKVEDYEAAEKLKILKLPKGSAD